MIKDAGGSELKPHDIVAFAIDKEKIAYAFIEEIEDNAITLTVYTKDKNYQTRIVEPQVSVIKVHK